MAAGMTASPGGIVEPFTTMGPFWLPTINTALLLTSGVTLTIAHHALIDGNRSKTIAFMWATVLLGVTFLFVQGYEYYHAYTAYNLKLNSGVFGSTFYMLTGFHGFHVFVGMLMLLFITLRLQKGHFTPERHFGFEAQRGTGTSWTWCGWVCTSGVLVLIRCISEKGHPLGALFAGKQLATFGNSSGMDISQLPGQQDT